MQGIDDPVSSGTTDMFYRGLLKSWSFEQRIDNNISIHHAFRLGSTFYSEWLPFAINIEENDA